MSVLLDSNIVIDFLRGRREAESLLDSLQGPPSVSTLTITEIHTGLKGDLERHRATVFFTTSHLVAVDAAIAALAGDLRSRFRASHGIDVADAVIGATAILRQLPLWTLNTKHFPMVADLRRPY